MRIAILIGLRFLRCLLRSVWLGLINNLPTLMSTCRRTAYLILLVILALATALSFSASFILRARSAVPFRLQD